MEQTGSVSERRTWVWANGRLMKKNISTIIISYIMQVIANLTDPGTPTGFRQTQSKFDQNFET